MIQLLKQWARDDRPLRKRIALAALTAFAASATFLVIGLVDLYMNNIGMFPFTLGDLAGPMLLTAFLSFAGITLLLSLLRGRYFDLLLSLVLGLFLAGYLQGNFLNIPMGELNGDAVQWGKYAVHSAVNAGVFTLIFLLPAVVCVLFRKVWRGLVVILPAAILLMETAGLIFTAATTDFSVMRQPEIDRENGQYLSEKGIFELSPNNNILVFILDRLDTKYIDMVEEDEPGFFNDLEGFTYYSNHTSLYCRTYPSVVYMLTGDKSYYDKPATQYFNEAYSSGGFLPALRSKGFSTKLYIGNYYSYNSIAQLEGLADNISAEKLEAFVNRGEMLKEMLKFSAFRYMPHALKRYFWLKPEDFTATVEIRNEEPPYDPGSYQLGEMLRQKGVTLSEEKDNFMYIHLNGCHEPFTISANGNYLSLAKSNVIDQTKGSFKQLQRYMKQMKKLGVYESSTIIITGDHGKSEDMTSPNTYKTTALFVKPAGSGEGDLQRSDKPLSHENFQATVLQAAGVDTSGFGKSIWDVGDKEEVVRQFLYKVNNPGGRVEEYEIHGDARNFANWTRIKNHPLKYDH